MSALPDEHEVDALMQALFLALDHGAPALFHIEHVGDRPLGSPSIEMLKAMAGHLMASTALLKRKLLATVFQSQFMNGPTKVMRDVFLGLYRPIKPLLFSDNVAEIEAFVAREAKSVHF